MNNTSISKSKIQGVILGIGFFLFSLSGASKILGVFSILFFLISTLASSFGKNHCSINVKYLVFFLFFDFYLLLSVTLLDNFSIYYVYLHFYLLVMFFLIVLFCSRMILLKSLDCAVKFYLLLHLASVFIQMSVYFYTGKYLNFYESLPGSVGHSAYLAKELDGSLIPIRVTGFFTEPSFYSMAIFPAVYYLYLRFKTSSVFFWFGIFSAVMTLSVAAVLVSFLIVFLSMKFEGFNVKKIIVLGPIFLVLIFLSVPFLHDRVFEFKTYDPIEYRLNIISEIQTRSASSNVYGAGYFLDEFSNNNGETGLSAAGVRDSGVVLSTFYSGGIIGLILLAIFMCFISNGTRQFLMLGVILLMKYSILSASFWFLITLLFLLRVENERKI